MQLRPLVSNSTRVRRSGEGRGTMVTDYVRISLDIFWISASAGMTVMHRPIYSQFIREAHQLMRTASSPLVLTGVGIVAEGPRCRAIIGKRNPPKFPLRRCSGQAFAKVGLYWPPFHKGGLGGFSKGISLSLPAPVSAPGGRGLWRGVSPPSLRLRSGLPQGYLKVLLRSLRAKRSNPMSPARLLRGCAPRNGN